MRITWSFKEKETRIDFFFSKEYTQDQQICEQISITNRQDYANEKLSVVMKRMKKFEQSG